MVPAPVVMGTAIRRNAESHVSLNDLHAASGSDPNKRPNQFLRTGPAKEFIREVTDAHICASPLQTVKGGNYQGTFAHELVALEYARWISPAFAIQVNQVFLAFHHGTLRPAFPTTADTLRLAADLAERNEAQAKQLQEMRPKALAFARLGESKDGDMLPTEAAKLLQIQPKQLFDWLFENHWIYRREGRNRRWMAHQDKLRMGLLRHKITIVPGRDGEDRSVAQVMVTRKGLARIAELLEQEQER